MQSFCQIVLLCIFLVSNKAWSRPEYAAELGIVNCAACHVNPQGGGARVINGKLFGSKDYKANWLSNQDIFSMDLRAQEYFSQKIPTANSQTKGMMLMNAIPTANLPIAPDPKSPTAAQLVMSYNFAPVGAALREAYFLYRFSSTSEASWVSSILFGNFSAPFGLMTDEHRTYTKQMVAMTNRSFESGLLMSGDPSYRFHYDFALSSGFSNGGVGTDTHPDSWAAFLNIRHRVFNFPMQVGLSFANESTSASTYNITALSAYGVLSLNPVNIQAEAVTAKGWNNSSYNTSTGDGIGYFIPSTTAVWQNALNDSSSFGFVTLLNLDLNRHWILQYKYEQFNPDSNYNGDSFNRNGIGFKYYFGSNMNLIARYDHGSVNRPGLTNTDLSGIKAIGDTYFALLHIWL